MTLSMIKNYRWLFLIVLLALFFRFFSLNETGLWMDEIHSAIGADPEKSIEQVLEYCKQDQPPLFFLLLHKWYQALGYNDFVGRLFGILTGLFGIIGIYFVGVEFKNSKVGLYSAFLTAINYFHIDYSRQVRFYPLVFLFASLSYLFFLRALKNKKPLDFLMYALSTAALLNTHYFGMVVFASQFLIFIFVVFVNRINDTKFILWSLSSATLAGLSFLHWVPVVLSDLQIASYHLPQVEWYFPIQYYYVYFRDPITCVVCGTLSLFAVREMVRGMQVGLFKLEYLVLLCWILLSFLIPLLYSLFKIPMLEYKYTFIALPAFFLLAAFGFDSDFLNQAFSKRRVAIKTYLCIVLVSMFVLNALFLKKLYLNRHPWQSWREVSQLVLKSDSKDQIVLSNFTWYFRYYFKIYESKGLIVEPRYIDIERLKKSQLIWVVTSTIFPDMGLEQAQQKLLSEKFVLDKEETFGDFTVKRFVSR